MRYIGEFTALNGHDYKVTITTAAEGEDKIMTLGAEPFVTAMDTDGGTIYAPAKYSAATVGVITGDYMFDVYSPTAQGTKVVLSDASGVVWTGYASPNLYDMGFVREREDISIECVDALSTLRNYKYLREARQVRSLADILIYVLQQCHAYTAVYVSNNTTLPQSSLPILDALYISEDNFYKNKDAGETDEDVAWSCQEVLEEICRYLNVTAIAEGDKVWLLDYDALRRGNPGYTVYSLDGETHVAPSAIAPYHITGGDYAAADARISLDNVYNKVTVSADMYTFDNLLPDLFDDAALENITSPKKPTINTGSRWWGNVSYMHQGKNGNLETLIDRGAVGRKEDSNFFVANQYMRSPYLTCEGTKNLTEVGWDTIQTIFGCVVKKEYVKEVPEAFGDKVTSMTDEEFVKWASSEVSNLSFGKSIMCCIRGTTKNLYVGDRETAIGTSQYDKNYKSYPMCTISVDKPGRLYGGDNAYIIISGNVVLSHNDNDAYDKGSFDYGTHYKSSVWSKWEYIYCRLQWGGKYWDGDKWTTTPCDFRLYFDTAEDKKMTECMYKSLQIRNTVRWWWGLEQSGCAIPVPPGEVLNDELKFLMYTPAQQYDDAGMGGQDDGRSYWVWIKDFAMSAVIGNPDYSGSADTDTVYTNVINEAYVTELDEIKCRICTWDNKIPNYSSVAYKSADGIYHYADKTISAATAAGEALWTGFDGTSGLRQEEHLIYRLVNQYSTPSIILTLPLHGGHRVGGTFTDTTIADRIFIIDSYEMDYKNDIQRVRLIEKK